MVSRSASRRGYNMSSLNGESAVVTGSSRGIGRAIALPLAREGAVVTVNHARIESEGEARSTVQEIGNAGGRAQIVRADVSEMSDLDRLGCRARYQRGE